MLVRDRWTAIIEDPAMTYATVRLPLSASSYHCAGKPAGKSEPPFHPYHPERFPAYRDHLPLVVEFFQQLADPDTGLLPAEQLADMKAYVKGMAFQRIAENPLRLEHLHPGRKLVAETEYDLTAAYCRYVQAGRQTMIFPEALTEMLAETGIDDIPLHSIELPCASQYLHFGPQANLEMEPGWLVDGAYVESRGQNGEIRFTVTSIPHNRKEARLWYCIPEPHCAQDILCEYGEKTFSAALGMVATQQMNAAARFARQAAGKEEFERVLILDAASYQEAMITRRIPVYKAAIQLVVNALCYITAYPEDIEPGWPEDAPKPLLEQWSRGNGEEKAQARSGLESMGYRPLKICGKRFAERQAALIAPPDSSDSCDSRRQAATRWRRGHWRNQPCGPSMSQRKLVWLMPVPSGAKHPEGPEDGHIYRVF